MDRVPSGWTRVRYRGRAWGLSRTDAAGGRAITVYAEELGGPGVISANVYRQDAWLLRPCEMPAEDVLDFLRSWQRDEGAAS